MADQPNIFSNEQQQETPATNNGTANTNTTTQEAPFADLLGSILNERGEPKYKTVQDALYGLKHAQEYIPQVKAKATEAEDKMHQLEAEVQRLKSLESTVLELTQQREQASTNGVTLGEQDIAQLVERTLTSRQQAEIQKENVKNVVSTLSAKFGAEAEKVFYTKAQEMGLTMEEMNALAAKTPKAVLTLLGVSEQVAHKQTHNAPVQGSINTSAFQQNPQSFVGREQKSTMIGSTSQDIKEAVDRASAMVDEFAREGITSLDLSNPKLYNKYFNK